MKKNLIIKQDGYKECGACCLLSIIRYYGGNISINKLIEYTCTSKTGTNFYNIKIAAKKFGIEAEAYQYKEKSKEDIQKLKTPSICQIISNNYEHFIVVYEIKSNKVIVMDPAIGERKINISQFLDMWTGYCMNFIITKPIPYINEEKYLNKIIINILRKNKSIVLNIVSLSILFTILSSIYAMYSGIIIDHILLTSKNNLLIVTLIFLIILLIKSILSFLRNKLLIYLNQHLDYSIFISSYRKILLLPFSYYKNRTTGEIISRINDLEYVKNMLSKIVLTLVLDVIISITCSIVLLKINITMFILLIITILIYIIIFIIFNPIIKKYTNINQENNAKINSLMIETINGYESIKNLNLEHILDKKMNKLYTNSLKNIRNYDNITNFEILLKDLITYLSLLIIEFIGFNFVFDNILSPGQIIVYTGLVTYLITPIRNIIDLNKEYIYAVNSLKRANNLLDIESIDLSSNTKYEIKGNIQLNNINYSYNNYNLILKNINLKIKSGEKVLIIGNSGSGKSTLLKLLAKYYPVENNKIIYDKKDINDISISNIRKYITMISQNEIIFTDTIKNNILFNRNIKEKEYKKICNITYVDEIVKDLFLGYNTTLEENGNNISGGQKQRIILARALLKSGNIILIDEGLNAIDINLERKILKNIFNRYKEKTIIIVSHRLENMDLFDRMIKIDNGSIEFNKSK
ncbi:MAG: peptidase domain-containing ABC transporter [Bacilli bacterium]|nr:peptidase domain-containing ABC transporter [Bacilli bacterium]